MKQKIIGSMFILSLITSCNSSSSSGASAVQPTQQNLEAGLLVGTWTSCTAFETGSDLDIYQFGVNGIVDVEVQSFDDQACSGTVTGNESINAKYVVTSTTPDTLHVTFTDVQMTPEPTDIKTIAFKLAIKFENSKKAQGKTTYVLWQDPEGNTGELSQEMLDIIPLISLQKVSAER